MKTESGRPQPRLVRRAGSPPPQAQGTRPSPPTARDALDQARRAWQRQHDQLAIPDLDYHAVRWTARGLRKERHA